MTGKTCHMQKNEECLICDRNCDCESTGELQMAMFAPEKDKRQTWTAAGGLDGDETLAADNV